MFILIPIVLILTSFVVILTVFLKKRSYIDKLFVLNVAGSESDSGVSIDRSFNWPSYGAEFFPEIKALLDKFKFHEYKTLWLTEAEKLLRRTRLLSLRVDRLSDTLIKKIRRSHVNGRLNNQIPVETAVNPRSTNELSLKQGAVKQEVAVSPNFLKNEEQRLIIEIAKNPKDPALYDVLGDLYAEMNNFTDAKESYEAALELNPGSQSVMEKLSLALEKINSQN